MHKLPTRETQIRPTGKIAGIVFKGVENYTKPSQ